MVLVFKFITKYREEKLCILGHPKDVFMEFPLEFKKKKKQCLIPTYFFFFFKTACAPKGIRIIFSFDYLES